MADLVNEPIYATDNDGTQYYDSGPVIFNEYDLETGVCILPLAEDPPDSLSELEDWSPVVKLQLHAPFRVRSAKYSSKKSTRPPILPAPGDAGAFLFTGGSISMHTVPNSGGGYDWVTNADYEYVENCVSRTQDGFVLGMFPFTLDTQAQNASLIGGTPAAPPIGAIAEAGADAQIGYALAQSGPNSYNCFSYFPGLFFNSGVMNADMGDSPQQFSSTLTGTA